MKDYIALLKPFYAFFGGLEDHIATSLVKPYLDDYPQRRKTALLAQDILFCGGELPTKAHTDALPEVYDPISAMGAIYVIEGSSLGGQIISRMIAKQLHASENSFSYFIGYGDQTESMWLRFKNSVNQLPEARAAELIKAGNDTFMKFKNWIVLNG